MMLPIGNKLPFKIDPRGFSLLEVMIATAVLALGATLIYQSFFIALDSYSYYAILLKASPWMDEKVWEVQDELKRLGSGAARSGVGQLDINDRAVDWRLSCDSLDATGNLYQIGLELSWLQGKRQIRLSRSAYAFYAE